MRERVRQARCAVRQGPCGFAQGFAFARVMAFLLSLVNNRYSTIVEERVPIRFEVREELNVSYADLSPRLYQRNTTLSY